MHLLRADSTRPGTRLDRREDAYRVHACVCGGKSLEWVSNDTFTLPLSMRQVQFLLDSQYLHPAMELPLQLLLTKFTIEQQASLSQFKCLTSYFSNQSISLTKAGNPPVYPTRQSVSMHASKLRANHTRRASDKRERHTQPVTCYQNLAYTENSSSIGKDPHRESPNPRKCPPTTSISSLHHQNDYRFHTPYHRPNIIPFLSLGARLPSCKPVQPAPLPPGWQCQCHPAMPAWVTCGTSWRGTYPRPMVLGEIPREDCSTGE